MGATKIEFQKIRENDDMFFSAENPYYLEEMERLNEGYNRMILGISPQ